MAERKSKRASREEPPVEHEEPQPLEAGLQGPSYSMPDREEDLPPDEYLLMKVVEANGQHLRTMRVGLGLGALLLVAWIAFGWLIADALGRVAAGLLGLLLIGGLLGVGLQALARQLDLLRRAVAATDHFIFGPAEEHDPAGHGHGHGPGHEH